MSGCWQCGADNDDAESIDLDNATPNAGDVSVCVYCRAVGIFTGNGYDTRPPESIAERARLLADPDVQSAIKMATMAHRSFVSENN